MRLLGPAAVSLALLAGCLEALAPEDVARLRDAQRADLRIYLQGDSGTPLDRQYARAAYCLVGAALESAGSAPFDAGPIACRGGPR